MTSLGPRMSESTGVASLVRMLTADIAVRIPAARTRESPSYTAIGMMYTRITAWPTHPKKWIELIFQYDNRMAHEAPEQLDAIGGRSAGSDLRVAGS